MAGFGGAADEVDDENSEPAYLAPVPAARSNKITNDALERARLAQVSLLLLRILLLLLQRYRRIVLLLLPLVQPAHPALTLPPHRRMGFPNF